MDTEHEGPNDSVPLDGQREGGRQASAHHPFDPGAALQFAIAIARWAADCEMMEGANGNQQGASGD